MVKATKGRRWGRAAADRQVLRDPRGVVIVTVEVRRAGETRATAGPGAASEARRLWAAWWLEDFFPWLSLEQRYSLLFWRAA
jgi:hypothetical protein